MTKVAILQSCYVPWKGYFDIIGAVDHFVIYDDVQYARRHWHNRNRIMTPQGAIWLTIPVNTKGQYLANIDQITVSEPWAERHWRTIVSNYAQAPFMSDYRHWLQDLYEHADKLEHLSDINFLFMKAIADKLGLNARFSWSRDYDVEGRKTDRLLALCKWIGATTYLSGPSAKTYFETDKFDAESVNVEWMDYSGYPEYPQLGPNFDHSVTIIDLLMNVGPDAASYLKNAPR